MPLGGAHGVPKWLQCPREHRQACLAAERPSAVKIMTRPAPGHFAVVTDDRVQLRPFAASALSAEIRTPHPEAAADSRRRPGRGESPPRAPARVRLPGARDLVFCDTLWRGRDYRDGRVELGNGGGWSALSQPAPAWRRAAQRDRRRGS